jgi:hypothetical protein
MLEISPGSHINDPKAMLISMPMLLWPDASAATAVVPVLVTRKLSAR